MKVRKLITYKFKKGQEIRLDTIYDIQALGGGDWWKPINEEKGGEDVIITKTIEITIITKFPSTPQNPKEREVG